MAATAAMMSVSRVTQHWSWLDFHHAPGSASCMAKVGSALLCKPLESFAASLVMALWRPALDGGVGPVG